MRIRMAGSLWTIWVGMRMRLRITLEAIEIISQYAKIGHSNRAIVLLEDLGRHEEALADSNRAGD